MATLLLVIVGFCENADTVKVRGKGIGVTKMETVKGGQYAIVVEVANNPYSGVSFSICICF